MTENKRFTLCEKGLDCYGAILDNDKIMNKEEIVGLLNELHEKNQELVKDNLQALALLGDVRALLRMHDTKRAIQKINKFEKEIFK